VPKRGRRATDAAAAQLEAFAQQGEQDLAQARALESFARRFEDGEITLTEFLQGPPFAGEDDADSPERLLEELLEAMLNEEPRRRPGAGGAGRGSRSRRR
jgi:hypothetical protein